MVRAEQDERELVVVALRRRRRATRVVTYNADVAAWAQRRRGLDGVSVAPVGRLAARSRAVGASSFSLEAFVETYEALYREIAEVPRMRD